MLLFIHLYVYLGPYNMRKVIILILLFNLICIPLVPAEECLITGCNQEICSDVEQPKVGICLWKPEYACYHQFGICEKDLNGTCSWTQTEQLLECLKKLQQETAGTEVY